MNIGFFDIVFMCNSQSGCVECEYKGNGCDKFSICFKGAIPCELWRSVTSFDNLIKYVNEWREYQNEQTIEH